MTDPDDAKTIADEIADVIASHIEVEDYGTVQEAAWAIYEYFYGDDL